MEAKSGPVEHYSECKVCKVRVLNSGFDVAAEYCWAHDPDLPEELRPKGDPHASQKPQEGSTDG